MHTKTRNSGSDLATHAQNAVDEMADAAKAVRSAAVNRASAIYQNAQEKAISGAKAADQVIRANPYKAIGIAFGVGLLFGYLKNRRD